MGSGLQSGSSLLILCLTPCPLCSAWNCSVFPILMPALQLAQSLVPDTASPSTLGPAFCSDSAIPCREVAPKEGPLALSWGRVGRRHLGWDLVAPSRVLGSGSGLRR